MCASVFATRAVERGKGLQPCSRLDGAGCSCTLQGALWCSQSVSWPDGCRLSALNSWLQQRSACRASKHSAWQRVSLGTTWCAWCTRPVGSPRSPTRALGFLYVCLNASKSGMCPTCLLQSQDCTKEILITSAEVRCCHSMQVPIYMHVAQPSTKADSRLAMFRGLHEHH
jgi:hypothetical protein